jgi:phage/plasmid-like protein (TIGR03299 family)
MSANVDEMMSVREMPWHGEGTILDDYPEGGWAEARKLAGLDWDPQYVPTYKQRGADEFGAPIYVKDGTWGSIERSDTGATLYHKDESTYSLITNTEMGEIMEAILEVPDASVKYETAGSLEGGRAVWALAKLDEPVTIPGDEGTWTMPYVALTNRHDGYAACAARATAVRIVCANTFRAAELEGERHGATYSFVHKGDWRDRKEDAKNAVAGARQEFRQYMELMTELSGVKVTKKQRERFIEAFIPEPPPALATERVMNNVAEARGKLRSLFESPTGIHVKTSAYGLVQCAGEYLDHVRAYRNQDTYINRTLLTPEAQKARAYKLAREVAKIDA